MKLWIRSQDKRILQKVDNVYLNANYDNRRICTNDSRDYESDLGEYKTKERALEVLDEIQNKLLKSKYDKASENYGKHSDYKDILIEISSSTYVYQMPEN